MIKYLSPIGLNVLKVAVEAGTFRAAAQLMCISQPAVSAHIHRIENELGIKLFERPYGRKLQLTEAGKLTYNYAIEILAINEELHKAAKEMACGETGQIRLAFSVGKFVIPSIVTAFRKKYPKINFVLRTGNSSRIQKDVINGKVDFGLSLFSEDPRILVKPAFREPIILVCAAGHPLASKKYVCKADLDHHGLLSGLYGSDYYRFINDGFASIGIYNLNIIAQVEEPEIVLKIIEEGGGIGLLLQSAAQKALERGYIVELSFSDFLKFPSMNEYLLFRKGSRPSPGVKLFLEFLYAEIPKRFPFIIPVQ